MLKWILVSLFLFYSQLSVGQTYSNIIPDQEIIHFMNDMLKSDDFEKFEPKRKRIIISKIRNWSQSSFIKNSENQSIEGRYLFKQISDSLISQIDLDCFLSQYEQLQAKRWRSKLFNARFIRKSYNSKTFKHFYSIPLFSADKSKAVIYKGFIMDRLTRGFGYYLYHKVNGKWILLEPLMQIQS